MNFNLLIHFDDIVKGLFAERWQEKSLTISLYTLCYFLNTGIEIHNLILDF
jgi:hypothetical protein